ncbi:MAG: hypothetical protein LBJ86_05015, partial [Spirochaetaceae bacterium]|nr:hypothetical protein [Spirochaetaceae bacterium]
KKWAFLADYVRAYAIYNYGGVYLDTDVEVIKPFDDLLENNICFSGFEDKEYVAPGLAFAGEKGCVIAKELMGFYKDFRFTSTTAPLNTVPKILTNLLLKYGLQQNNTYQNLKNIAVYPSEYFCPKSYKTGTLTLTDNTYSIHHYKASWVSDKEKKKIEERWHIFDKYGDNELSNKLAVLVENDITEMPIGCACKIILKRIVKKILGRKLFNFLKKCKHSNSVNHGTY